MCHSLAPAPPPVDLPTIIPLTSAPPPAPHPPPPPAPPLPTQVAPPPPLLIPPPVSNTDGGEGALPSLKNDDDDEGSSGNPLMDQIRNFAKRKLKAADQATPVNPTPISNSNEQENIMDMLKERLKQRRGFITGDTAPSSAPKPIAAPTPPPATGGAFTDAIALKAKEIAATQEKNSDGDDNDNDNDWE